MLSPSTGGREQLLGVLRERGEEDPGGDGRKPRGPWGRGGLWLGGWRTLAGVGEGEGVGSCNKPLSFNQRASQDEIVLHLMG